MRRTTCTLTLALGLAALPLVAGGPTAGSAPAPSFAVTLAVDGSCNFKATATWAHVKPSGVIFTWTHDGVEFGDGPDSVTSFNGHKAVDSKALAVDTVNRRDFVVTAAFFVNGTQVGTATSATMNAACSFSLV